MLKKAPALRFVFLVALLCTTVDIVWRVRHMPRPVLPLQRIATYAPYSQYPSIPERNVVPMPAPLAQQ